MLPLQPHILHDLLNIISCFPHLISGWNMTWTCSWQLLWDSPRNSPKRTPPQVSLLFPSQAHSKEHTLCPPTSRMPHASAFMDTFVKLSDWICYLLPLWSDTWGRQTFNYLWYWFSCPFAVILNSSLCAWNRVLPERDRDRERRLARWEFDWRLQTKHLLAVGSGRSHKGVFSHRRLIRLSTNILHVRFLSGRLLAWF